MRLELHSTAQRTSIDILSSCCLHSIALRYYSVERLGPTIHLRDEYINGIARALI